MIVERGLGGSEAECPPRRSLGLGEPAVLVERPGEGVVGENVGSGCSLLPRQAEGLVETAIVVGVEEGPAAGPLPALSRARCRRDLSHVVDERVLSFGLQLPRAQHGRRPAPQPARAPGSGRGSLVRSVAASNRPSAARTRPSRRAPASTRAGRGAPVVSPRGGGGSPRGKCSCASGRASTRGSPDRDRPGADGEPERRDGSARSPLERAQDGNARVRRQARAEGRHAVGRGHGRRS